MNVKSNEGFIFSTSMSKAGSEIALVAHKNEHGRRRAEVFHFSPEAFGKLINEMQHMFSEAKARRKAIYKAANPSIPWGPNDDDERPET